MTDYGPPSEGVGTPPLDAHSAEQADLGCSYDGLPLCPYGTPECDCPGRATKSATPEHEDVHLTNSHYERAVDVVLRNMPECEDHEPTRDEAQDIVDGLRSANLLDLSLADDVRTISATISGTYPPDLDSEAHLWRRVMKVSEEVGEVTEALLGWLGENPRKGVTHNRADLRDELLDVAGAALGAVSHLYGDLADPVDMLAERLAYVRVRLVAATRIPPGRRITDERPGSSDA